MGRYQNFNTGAMAQNQTNLYKINQEPILYGEDYKEVLPDPRDYSPQPHVFGPVHVMPELEFPNTVPDTQADIQNPSKNYSQRENFDFTPLDGHGMEYRGNYTDNLYFFKMILAIMIALFASKILTNIFPQIESGNNQHTLVICIVLLLILYLVQKS